MGSAQSSHTTNTNDSASFTLKDQSVAGVRGRKAPTLHDASEPTERTVLMDDEMEDILPQSAWSDDDEDDDEEDDEDLWEEREAILQEARDLKMMAAMFLHPEAPVAVDGTAIARCYFGRPSAPEQEDVEEVNERASILDDLVAMKKLALNFAHPEVKVETTDPTAFSRNYFLCPSAVQDFDGAEERDAVFADLMELKKSARQYMHPEGPVLVDGFACGRNYFSHPSAPELDTEELEEREATLSDVAGLRKLAKDYFHPEVPVVTTDPFTCGRNYFLRPSADVEDEDKVDVMSDLAALKQSAIDYLHPESFVLTDPAAFGRNYFNRPSAVEQDDVDDTERAAVLADAMALKQLAEDYAHPERPVVTSDPCAKGRNYFSRYSASEQLSLEDAEEKALLVADLKMLQKSVTHYMHPELPVTVSDPTVSSRCYFTRPSAPSQMDMEEDEELTQILSEMGKLKALVAGYAHPEIPVSSDATACARNYLTRASAPDDELPSEQDLEDISTLRKYASYYLHPEKYVEDHGMNCTRNYFTRHSAEDMESVADAEERVQVLADALALKKSAVDFMHPELPVVVSDPAACSRCYFDRFSASTPEQLGMIYSIGHANVEHHHHHEMVHDDSSHHEHHDHFEMDEDIFGDFRSSFRYAQDHVGESEVYDKPTGEEEEGKLSRSPSSVMLFDQGLEGF